MNTFARIVAGNLRLARDGASFTQPSPGTVGRESKPGNNDAAWVDIGPIESVTISPQGELKEQFAPAPGKLVRLNAHEIRQALNLSWTCQQVSPLAIELLLKAGVLDANSTQFNPLAGGTKRFWAQIQLYDQDNAFVVGGDLFGTLRITSALTLNGQEYMQPEMEFLVLHSSLQTFTV